MCLVLTPQLLWFTAHHFINAHPSSFQLIVTYFAFPAMEEKTVKKKKSALTIETVCAATPDHVRFMSFAMKVLVLSSAW